MPPPLRVPVRKGARFFPRIAKGKGLPRKVDVDGSAATGTLRIPPPPDTSGYTTLTLTEQQSKGYNVAGGRDIAAQSRLILTLDDATDYVIVSPYVITRPVVLDGGRNIVWKACHIQMQQLGIDFFPGGDYVAAMQIEDGASAVDRIIHFEGHWYEGDDLGDCITLGHATHVGMRIGHMRVGSNLGPYGPRSSDAWGKVLNAGLPNQFPPNSSHGTRMYQGVAHNHSDLWKANDDYRYLYVDCATIEHAAVAWHFDHGPDSVNRISRCNVRSGQRVSDQEGPLGTETQTWTANTNRATFEATQDGFTSAAGGATLTFPYTTAPLAGAQSLQVTKTNPTVHFIGAGRTSGTALDWSDAGNATALGALVKVVSSDTDFPTMRIDATDDPAAAFSTEENWYIGQAHACTVGVTRQLVCPFPREVLSAIRKVRVVLVVDETGAGSHEFIVDTIASGTGLTRPSFTGPTLVWEGKWALFHGDANFADDTAGDLYVQDFWGKPKPGNLFKNNNTGDGSGTNYSMRYWDPDAGGVGVGGYVNDPAPGDATHVDYYYPAPPSMGTDGTGDYVTWSSTVGPKVRAISTPTIPGSAKMYNGDPPGGDFSAEGIAGIGYTSPSTYEMFMDVSSGQSTATLALTAPFSPITLQASAAVSTATLALRAATTIPLDTSAALSTATLALTAPTQIPLGTSAAVSTATLALKALTQIPLGTSAAVSTATLALTAKTTIPLGTSAATSTASLALTAATQIPLGASAATSSATLALTAQTYVTLGTSAALSNATLALTATGAATIPLSVSAAIATASLGLTAKTTVVLATASATSTATLLLTALGSGPLVEDHPDLGGVFDETVTGGAVVEYTRNGAVVAKARSGYVVAPSRSGAVSEPSRSADPDNPARSGTFDESLTNGEVL